MPPEWRLTRQDRQFALLVERLDAHHSGMAPERTAIADPPRLTHGVGAHAVPHAELENSRERTRRRHADDKALEDADLGVRLHHARELHDLVAGHQAVGIERQHQFEVAAPLLAEFTNVKA